MTEKSKEQVLNCDHILKVLLGGRGSESYVQCHEKNCSSMKEVPAQFDLIGMDLLAGGNIINCQPSLKFELGCVQLL